MIWLHTFSAVSDIDSTGCMEFRRYIGGLYKIIVFYKYRQI